MAKWILKKSFRFEASHQLPQHSGKCQRLHGHSWVLEVAISSKQLIAISGDSSEDMVLDYGHLKNIVQPLVDSSLDHYHLNDSTGLKNPTSEKIAEWVYRKIMNVVPQDVEIEYVKIGETCTSECEYRP